MRATILALLLLSGCAALEQPNRDIRVPIGTWLTDQRAATTVCSAQSPTTTLAWTCK